MTGFAINANAPVFTKQPVLPSPVVSTVQEAAPRDAEWFKGQLEARGVRGFEIICGDYRSNFDDVPPELMDEYLELRPKKLHRYAVEAVMGAHAQKTKPAGT